MIKLENLTLGYNKNILVNDINFTIQENQCCGVFGPNGSGKSTLFLTLLGLIKPISGNIEIFGKSPVDVREITSLMPQQDPSEAIFYHKLSSYEILKSALTTKHSWGLPLISYRNNQKIIALLNKMRSLDLLNEPYNNLSGGQRQVIRLVQAMLSNPKILLLDEPLTGLDKKSIANFVDLIKEIKSEYTILIISHDIEPLKPILDLGILFHDKTYIAGDLNKIEKHIDPYDECNR